MKLREFTPEQQKVIRKFYKGERLKKDSFITAGELMAIRARIDEEIERLLTAQRDFRKLMTERI